MQANDLRRGAAIVLNGQLYIVMSAEHRTPGNKRAFMQAELRELRTGKIIQQKLSSTESVEEANLESRHAQYSYKDPEGYHFMDLVDYHSFTIPDDIVGNQKYYIKENDEVDVDFHDGIPVLLELPAHVALKVTEAPPGVKGDSVSNTTKSAMLETGLKIQVPLFIREGEIIKVDTRTGNYLSRQ
ncbi:MAG: elongation factor P [Omnitrophica bacterium RIFCSPLOWO2_12_FULL_44_17]|uniref:Elongation factor P n=1 Tax=Candidatus Danuiimicrobium aquiferis TaxID=1801832 RepID=A0A1G1L2L2_9BACT|nr:MAG: elongation factor P [Omnitrophica bacterium RIFCSPHIGHO2_02_FULL_45_28]OGW92490.1 MAG: elongation factor P [Omnitrophica bacterium RIFCSPHIGHO2_12_FULL_44_12]OGW99364.1 MAG: elongation factor P [Omnitrophica bacterium RIFCSPLOWO2_12_FULL_44_17]OGX03238.1 MAG: elongation factor P [Omnitrophica bacterium RIFCSPLOWO2_02_FULL_44_11]